MPALAGRPAGRAPTHRPGHHRAGRPARPLRATPLHDDEASAPPNPPPPPLILHFAYGANMDPAVLGRRGLTGPAWATPAVARGWRLAFNHRAAYANLEEGGSPAEAREGLASHPPDTTPPPPPPPPPPPWPADPHGVLYGLAPPDWAALVAAEGGYGVRQVEVVTYGGAGGGRKKEGGDSGGSGGGAWDSGRPGGGGSDSSSAAARPATAPLTPPPPGTILTASAFVSSPWARLKGGALPPRPAYLASLAAGARARGLEAGYCAWLGAIPVVEAVPGRGLPAAYYATRGRDAVVWGGAGLAAGMLGWALAGGVL